MTSNLIRAVSDQVEKLRILSLNIINESINILGEEGKNVYEQFVPILIERVSKVPLVENSEDVRLLIFKLLVRFIDYKDCLLKNVSQLAVAMSRGVVDGYDLIK